MSRQRLFTIAIAAGVAIGVIYSLSPATVISLAIVAAMSSWAAKDLTSGERRVFVSMIAVAVVARLLLVAALFMSSDGRIPVETFFGDELFFKSKSLWIRNIGLDLPMSPADVIYAYEDVGISSYLYGLALVQALIGNVPYGIHVINSACYLAGALLLFRFVRPVFGGVAALAGLAVMLFTPSLFIWSISALKEPSYTLAAAIELVCALQMARSPTIRGRLFWLLGVIAGAVALESLRRGGGMVALAGVAGGLFLGYAISRPKVLLAAVVLLPAIAIGALRMPPVQERALNAVRSWAIYHAGHVGSPGYSYRILEGRYYVDYGRVRDMPGDEAIEYMVRSYVSYVTEPVPWRIESRAMLAYLPEQMFWYVLLALTPFGIAAGARRDAMLTMLLLAHAFGAATVVAMTSGNIGTLIRHRGLVMPYLVWLAGLGLYELVRIAVRTPTVSVTGGLHAHGHS
jgi:hypothetical protein